MRQFSSVNSFKLLLALALLASAQPAPAQQTATATARIAAATLPAATVAAAEQITAEKLKKDLYFVASDEMAGRDTPSKGLDETAKFIADRLAQLKVKPAGDDGTYFQRIELVSTKVDPAKTSGEIAGRTLKYGDDFLAGTVSGTASGALVFVGHGFRVKSKNVDAYAGLDVRDKIVVAARGVLPKGLTRADFKGKAGEGEWDDAASYARKNGARGLVLIPANYDRYWPFALRLSRNDRFQVARFINQDTAAGMLPVMYPTESLAKQMFAGEARAGEEIIKGINAGDPGAGFDLNAQKRLSFTVAAETKTATTSNVIGVLEGSDSKLKKEYVALGAHYDHVGVGRPDKNGDTIYNGADDDGSGTVAVLAAAEAFAKGPRPKRSILFVWHTAEEKGLWGSEYFAEYPTVPLNQIVAQLNIDMIGRSKQPGDTNPANKQLTGPNEIYVIGSKEMSSELGQLSERVNAAYLGVKFNYFYDDPRDTERLFYRSDHFNYAKKGIPIIFYFDGVHEDYHRPSDTADKIDYQKMERITRTVFATASEIANGARRPTVDKPLTPERIGAGGD